eukprot:gnl/MRDRNA2_/MRDRNA2_60248_c0_seq3.p1 gnl/MRDRNA2_/MRDRNA2_60248_c0~~gnl/MRDRNA2_/MRDRNA2_60248_c0_seq3.p1  ORF type:complete len:359 (+),score=59.91 gnl/MRDRNA2_/MRDRNA2_60248_c0_seq3:71-1147(+)
MLVTRRQMQSIYEEDALPTLLGSSRQRQFFHKGKMHAMPKGWEAHTPGEAPPADLDEISEPPRTKAGKCAFHKGNMHGMPRGWEAHMPGGTKNELSDLDELSDGRRTNDDKWRVLEEFSSSKWRRFDEKKQRGAKPQPSAAEQPQSAATPKLQDSHVAPCGPGFETFQQNVEAFPHRQAAKTIGNHPQARSGANHLLDEWPISASAVGTAWVTEKAQKEVMAAVARNDAKRTEELVSTFGPSLKLGSNWPLTDKVCKLLLAPCEVPVLKQGRDIKKGGLLKHAGKEILAKTFKDGHKQFCLDKDLTKLNAKENQAAAPLGRSASVPHIWANTSYPVSVPKRGVSNTRTRQKPIYQSDA